MPKGFTLAVEDESIFIHDSLVRKKMWTVDKGSPEFNAMEECWRQGKYDQLVSRYYPRFDDFRRMIANYYKTRRFKLDISKYLTRDVS